MIRHFSVVSRCFVCIVIVLDLFLWFYVVFVDLDIVFPRFDISNILSIFYLS